MKHYEQMNEGEYDFFNHERSSLAESLSNTLSLSSSTVCLAFHNLMLFFKMSSTFGAASFRERALLGACSDRDLCLNSWGCLNTGTADVIASSLEVLSSSNDDTLLLSDSSCELTVDSRKEKNKNSLY